MSSATTTAQRRGLLDRLLGRRTAAVSSPAPAPIDDVDSKTPARIEVVSIAPPTPRPRPTWPSLVARVREVTRANAVVAIDEEGLIVASTGDREHAELEAIAAHVALGFDLFERLTMLGETTESICAQYTPEGTWLTAIRMRPPVGGPMTVAIVGPYTMIREDRRRIHDAFARLFDAEPVEPTSVPTD